MERYDEYLQADDPGQQDRPMKVRIAYTVEIYDEFRRGINRYYGRPGLATREQVRSWFISFGESMNADIMTDLAAHEDDTDDD